MMIGTGNVLGMWRIRNGQCLKKSIDIKKNRFLKSVGNANHAWWLLCFTFHEDFYHSGVHNVRESSLTLMGTFFIWSPTFDIFLTGCLTELHWLPNRIILNSRTNDDENVLHVSCRVLTGGFWSVVKSSIKNRGRKMLYTVKAIEKFQR